MLTRSLSYPRRRLQITALEAEFERRKEEYLGELERAKKVSDSESDYLGQTDISVISKRGRKNSIPINFVCFSGLI